MKQITIDMYGISNGIFTFTLTYSKGQGQGHAHFNSEHHGNGDAYSKSYYCPQIASNVWTFD